MPPSNSNFVQARSPGKLNLTFDILGDLPGGYHEVETLMQTVNIEDHLLFSFERANNFSFEITSVEFAGTKSDVPVDQSNLIAKAASLFSKTVSERTHSADIAYKVTVQLKKAIPVAGGMGGGSGNAAATLMVLNEHFDDVFSDVELKQMAGQIGADVPFFINGGAQIGTHRGDILNRVDSKTTLSFLIVGPTLFGMSTPAVYRAYDEEKNTNGGSPRISANACAEALAKGDSKNIAETFGNAFESCVFARKPELSFITSRLKQLGGYCTHLTGSGPTIYVLTENDSESRSIQARFHQEKSRNANGWSEWPDLSVNSWIAVSTDSGVIIE